MVKWVWVLWVPFSFVTGNPPRDSHRPSLHLFRSRFISVTPRRESRIRAPADPRTPVVVPPTEGRSQTNQIRPQRDDRRLRDDPMTSANLCGRYASAHRLPSTFLRTSLPPV